MFRKYNSIENSYREEFLSRIKGHFFWDETYVVQEKAHGANLSFWTTDGINFHTGKRTTRLEMGDRFYNYESILSNVKPKLKNIWTALKKKNASLSQVTIFGELIGGNYPHPDVKKNNNAIKVQKGVFYSPDNCFYAFDILVDNNRYLDIDLTIELFEQEDLLYAKTLFRGSLEEVLRFPNAFDSVISGQLNLPAITPNICEGTIIRPVKNLNFRNGVRVILKNKNDKWSETIKRDRKHKKVIDVPEKVAELQTTILDYITENRLNNVISKFGEPTKKDFGKLLGMFNKDIIEDFLKDHQKVYNELDKKEMKMVNKSISKVSVKMVRKACIYT